MSRFGLQFFLLLEIASEILFAMRWCMLSIAILSGLFRFDVKADDSSASYEIEGTVVFSGKPLKEPETGTFVVRVDGCDWNIRFKRPNDSDYTEVGYDGTNLVSLFSYENFSKGKKVANLATVSINKNTIPRSEFTPEFAMIWLAYGSKCYFENKAQGDLLEPVITFDSQGQVDRRKEVPLYQTTWKRQAQFPFLPTEVVYLESNKYFKAFTNSIFSVSSFVNYGGFEYPKTATLETYQFLQQSNSTGVELKLFSKYELNLTAIHNITVPHFTPRPVLPGATLFVDDRIPQVGQITYLSSNWMTESQLINNKGFKALVAKQKKYQENNYFLSESQISSRRKFILIVFVALSLIPLRKR
jgi:hypothetical protein